MPQLAQRGIVPYGLFIPLFGLASNEIYLVTNAESAHDPGAISAPPLVLKQSTQLVPTVRPREHTPRTRPGIYVFRWFDVYNKDIDEIVRLSDEAWTSFEGGFDTEIQGLFRQPSTQGNTGKMLLVTWYKDLSVWEASRMPSAAARQNFLRRAELTIEALPVCTRLNT